MGQKRNRDRAGIVSMFQSKISGLNLPSSYHCHATQITFALSPTVMDVADHEAAARAVLDEMKSWEGGVSSQID